MWQFTLNVKDGAEAEKMLTELEDRPELGERSVVIMRYPDDRMMVGRAVDRAPLAALAEWGLGFSTARLSLSDDAGYDGD